MREHSELFYERREKLSESVGKARENFFLEVFHLHKASWPVWITDIRKAAGSEDDEGIDFVVCTSDVGDIFVQIKGSWSGIHDFIRKPRKFDVCVILTRVDMNRNELFLKTKKLLQEMRIGRLSGDRSKILFE